MRAYHRCVEAANAAHGHAESAIADLQGTLRGRADWPTGPDCGDVSCTYEDVANLLSDDLGLIMPAGNLESLGRVLANARSYEANQPSRPEMTK